MYNLHISVSVLGVVLVELGGADVVDDDDDDVGTIPDAKRRQH